MCLLHLIIDKDPNEREGDLNIERNILVEILITQKKQKKKWKKEIFITLEWVLKEGDQEFIMYKEICSLCDGNGYITVVVKEKDEIKQCWLCESQGEKKCDTNTQ